MSASVSQLEFWKEGAVPNASNESNADGGEGALFLSYKIFLGLSVLGGFLALDHLYLRSPLTFLAKLAVNIMCFGVWWLYDAMHAIFNRDVVQLYGLGVPGLGPKGIAAGVLVNEQPDKKHMRFFTYAMALIFGGLFGIDSFIVGDKQSGILRILSLITVIFAPIAFGWWVYKLFKFFTDTKTVLGEYHEYFGAPASASLKDQALSKYPFLASLFNPVEYLTALINNILGPIIQPLKGTLDTALKTMDTAISTVDHTVDLGRAAIDKGSTMVGQIANIVTKTADALSASSGVIPGASLYQTITPDSVKKEMSKPNGKPNGKPNEAAAEAAADAAKTIGGALLLSDSLNPLHYVLVGTIVLIIVSGFAVTYFRSYGPNANNANSKKHGTENQDDDPPEPGVL